MEEKKYVDFDKVITTYKTFGHLNLHNALEAFNEIPAADVRPVVFCRDCLHYEMGACLKIYDDGAANKDAWQERKPDDFCSYGEDKNVPTNCGADMRGTNE